MFSFSYKYKYVLYLAVSSGLTDFTVRYCGLYRKFASFTAELRTLPKSSYELQN